MIDCYYKTTVDASSIHCQGRFTNEPIEQGKLVLRINGNIYKNENNSFVNHSTNNNIFSKSNSILCSNLFSK